MNSLLDDIRSRFTPAFIGAVAAQTNKPENTVVRAALGMAPALLAGMLRYSGENGDLKTLLARTSGDQRDLPALIFGAQFPSVLHTLAAFSGIGTKESAMIFEETAPLVVSCLLEHSPDILVEDLLEKEENAILTALPTGMTAIPGLVAIPSDEPETSADWLLPFLLLAVLGGTLLFYLKGC